LEVVILEDRHSRLVAVNNSNNNNKARLHSVAIHQTINNNRKQSLSMLSL
jgi:hypothetical protein